MEKTALFITVILLATTCDAFFFNIDEKGHKKYVSDRNFFLEAQAKDSKFLCSVMVVNGYENSDINVFGFAPNIVYIYINFFNYFTPYSHASKNVMKATRGMYLKVH